MTKSDLSTILAVIAIVLVSVGIVLFESGDLLSTEAIVRTQATPSSQPTAPRAQALTSTEGITVQQVDFDYPEAFVRSSSWGRLTVDSRSVLQRARLSKGFLNLRTERGWTVQNLYLNARDDPRFVTTYFDLGINFPEPVARLSAVVMVSPGPLARLGPGQRLVFTVTPTLERTGGVGELTDQRENRPLNAPTITRNAPAWTGLAVRSRTTVTETRDVPEEIVVREPIVRQTRPRIPTEQSLRTVRQRPTVPVYEEPRTPRATFSPSIDLTPPSVDMPLVVNFPTWTFSQPNQVNLEAAQNQCVPMSVANSLQYLENSYGLQIPNNHAAGLKGDNTLVGQLDTEMNRTVTNRRTGSGVWFQPMLDGKFSYLSKKGLSDFFTHKHQGTGWGNANNGEALPAGDYSKKGITSESKGATVTWDWVCDEIKKGEDVELIYSRQNAAGAITGGHAVRVFECGQTLGMPWLGYLHDKDQTNDTAGLETVRQFVLDTDGDGLMNFGAAGREVQFAIAESPAPGMAISSAQPMTYQYQESIGWY